MIDEIKSILETNEKVIAEVTVEREGIFKSLSTRIYLTNKKLIYWRGIFKSFKLMKLSDISSFSYVPGTVVSSGYIHVTQASGRTKRISESVIGQVAANDFIKKANKFVE